jgi:hypothetical protein
VFLGMHREFGHELFPDKTTSSLVLQYTCMHVSNFLMWKTAS